MLIVDLSLLLSPEVVGMSVAISDLSPTEGAGGAVVPIDGSGVMAAISIECSV